MPSPFPGMDPYLEAPAFWSDFRFRFLNNWSEAIVGRLPQGYDARIDERVSAVGRSRVERRQRYLKIVQRPDRTLVTVIELLSPWNKVGAGRRDYMANRDAPLWQEINLVELDLLRAGRRLPLRRPLPPGDYYYLVSRSDRRPDCDVYAWTLRQPLPALPIPLSTPDPDVLVDLEDVFTTAYDRGRYAGNMPYDKPPPGPLSDEDRAWALERAATAVQ